MNIPDVAIGVAIGAVCSAIIAGVFQLLGKRIDGRQATRQMIVTAAVENWKYRTEKMIEVAKEKKINTSMLPLDSFLIHTMKIAEVLDGPATEAAILKKLDEAWRLSGLAVDFAKARSSNQE